MPAEVTVVWHHDLARTMRYRLIDASDHGFRLHSATPMLSGTTGTVLRLLPEGTPVDAAVNVVWCRPDPRGGFYLGLHRMR